MEPTGLEKLRSILGTLYFFLGKRKRSVVFAAARVLDSYENKGAIKEAVAALRAQSMGGAPITEANAVALIESVDALVDFKRTVDEVF